MATQYSPGSINRCQEALKSLVKCFTVHTTVDLFAAKGSKLTGYSVNKWFPPSITHFDGPAVEGGTNFSYGPCRDFNMWIERLNVK